MPKKEKVREMPEGQMELDKIGEQERHSNMPFYCDCVIKTDGQINRGDKRVRA